MFQQSQKMEVMNYTTVTSDLGVCNISLPSVAVSRPQNRKQKIEREGSNSGIQLKKTMPGDDTLLSCAGPV